MRKIQQENRERGDGRGNEGGDDARIKGMEGGKWMEEWREGMEKLRKEMREIREWEKEWRERREEMREYIKSLEKR